MDACPASASKTGQTDIELKATESSQSTENESSQSTDLNFETFPSVFKVEINQETQMPAPPPNFKLSFGNEKNSQTINESLQVNTSNSVISESQFKTFAQSVRLVVNPGTSLSFRDFEAAFLDFNNYRQMKTLNYEFNGLFAEECFNIIKKKKPVIRRYPQNYSKALIPLISSDVNSEFDIDTNSQTGKESFSTNGCSRSSQSEKSDNSESLSDLDLHTKDDDKSEKSESSGSGDKDDESSSKERSKSKKLPKLPFFGKKKKTIERRSSEPNAKTAEDSPLQVFEKEYTKPRRKTFFSTMKISHTKNILSKARLEYTKQDENPGKVVEKSRKLHKKKKEAVGLDFIRNFFKKEEQFVLKTNEKKEIVGKETDNKQDSASVTEKDQDEKEKWENSFLLLKYNPSFDWKPASAMLCKRNVRNNEIMQTAEIESIQDEIISSFIFEKPDQQPPFFFKLMLKNFQFSQIFPPASKADESFGGLFEPLFLKFFLYDLNEMRQVSETCFAFLLPRKSSDDAKSDFWFDYTIFPGTIQKLIDNSQKLRFSPMNDQATISSPSMTVDHSTQQSIYCAARSNEKEKPCTVDPTTKEFLFSVCPNCKDSDEKDQNIAKDNGLGSILFFVFEHLPYNSSQKDIFKPYLNSSTKKNDHSSNEIMQTLCSELEDFISKKSFLTTPVFFGFSSIFEKNSVLQNEENDEMDDLGDTFFLKTGNNIPVDNIFAIDNENYSSVQIFEAIKKNYQMNNSNTPSKSSAPNSSTTTYLESKFDKIKTSNFLIDILPLSILQESETPPGGSGMLRSSSKFGATTPNSSCLTSNVTSVGGKNNWRNSSVFSSRLSVFSKSPLVTSEIVNSCMSPNNQSSLLASNFFQEQGKSCRKSVSPGFSSNFFLLNRIFVPQLPLIPGNSLDLAKKAVCFPQQPHTQIANTIYIHAQKISYPSYSTYCQQLKNENTNNYNNIVVEAILRNGNENVRSLVTKTFPHFLTSKEISSVYFFNGSSSSSKGVLNCNIFDEFKVDFAFPLKENLHILFVFYKVLFGRTEETQETSNFGVHEKKIVGYSILDLTKTQTDDDDSIVRVAGPGTYSLPIYNSLLDKYNDPAGISRQQMNSVHVANKNDKFEVEIGVSSFCTPNGPMFRDFVEKFDHFMKRQEVDKLNDLLRFVFLNSPDGTSNANKFLEFDFHFFFPLLNSLFLILSTNSNDLDSKKEEAFEKKFSNLKNTVFECILGLLDYVGNKRFGGECSRENPVLRNYVDIIFSDNLNHTASKMLPLFSFLPQIINQNIDNAMNSQTSSSNISRLALNLDAKSLKKKDIESIASKKKTSSTSSDKNGDSTKQKMSNSALFFEYSWFFLDLISKSVLILHEKMNENSNLLNSNDQEETKKIVLKFFQEDLVNFVGFWSKSVWQLLVGNEKTEKEAAKEANRQFALFLTDIFPFFVNLPTPNSFAQDLKLRIISTYLQNLEYESNPKAVFLVLDFYKIISDDYFTLFQSGSENSSSSFKILHPFFDSLFFALKTANSTSGASQSRNSSKKSSSCDYAIDILVEQFTKLDSDENFMNDETIRQNFASECFFDFVIRFLREKDAIFQLNNNVTESKMSYKSYGELCLCIIWLLKNMRKEKIEEIVENCGSFIEIANLFSIFEFEIIFSMEIVGTFNFSSLSSSKSFSLTLVETILSILRIILSKVHLLIHSSEIRSKTSKKIGIYSFPTDDGISDANHSKILFDDHITFPYQRIIDGDDELSILFSEKEKKHFSVRKTQNSKDYSNSNTDLIVSALMNSICHCFRIVLGSVRYNEVGLNLDIKQDLFSTFSWFVTAFMQELFFSAENEESIDEVSIFRWKTIVGLLLTFVEFPSSQNSKNSLNPQNLDEATTLLKFLVNQYFCSKDKSEIHEQASKLSRIYSNLDVFEAIESQISSPRTPKEESLIVYDENGLIKGATMHALLDRLFDLSEKPENEQKETNFKNKFLLVHSSFVNPKELLTKLISYHDFLADNKKNEKIEEEIAKKKILKKEQSRIRLLNFFADFLATDFKLFSLNDIAMLISFIDNEKFYEISPTTAQKLKRYVIKELLQKKSSNSSNSQENSTNPSPIVTKDQKPSKEAAKLSKMNEFLVPKDFDLEKYSKPSISLENNKNFSNFKRQTLIPGNFDTLNPPPTSRIKQLSPFLNPFGYEFEITNWNGLEIAKNLTIIESELFKSIQPMELFGLSWSKKFPENVIKSPNIVRICERFNALNNFWQRLVLFETKLSKRVEVLRKVLEILKFLKDLNNFQSIAQITSALNSLSVGRLKKTIEGVTNPAFVSDNNENSASNLNFKELLTNFNEMTELFGSPPYTKLRKLVFDAAAAGDTNGIGVIPFMGMFLTELTFIEHGNKDYVVSNADASKKLINFAKRRLYLTTIDNINLCQNPVYKFKGLPYLQYIFRINATNENEFWDEDKLYSKSIILEPKENQS